MRHQVFPSPAMVSWAFLSLNVTIRSQDKGGVPCPFWEVWGSASDASLNSPSSKDACESRCCRKQRHGVLVAESLITAGDFRKYVGDSRETEIVDARRPVILRTPQLQLLYLDSLSVRSCAVRASELQVAIMIANWTGNAFTCSLLEHISIARERERKRDGFT